jgi:hypothetical protein
MGRHTIGDKRGSVRGAPPDVYIPFGTFQDDEDDLNEAFRPVIKFFGQLALSGLLFVFVIFWCVIYYAFKSKS